MAQIDSDIRAKTQSYNEAKTLSLQTAKKEGTLYTRDLSDIFKKDIVNPIDFVYSSHITTLVCIVHKTKAEFFMKNYYLISKNVIPDSLKLFDKYEDKEGLLVFRV